MACTARSGMSQSSAGDSDKHTTLDSRRALGLAFENLDRSCPIVPCRSQAEQLQAVLLDDGEELDGHAAGLFCAALPLLHRGLAGVEEAGKDRLADGWLTRIRLICSGAKLSGTARQDASKCRIVALSSAPTLNIVEAEEWIASKASLLNLRLRRHGILPGCKSQTNPSPEAVDRPAGPQHECKPSQAPGNRPVRRPRYSPGLSWRQVFIHPKLPSLTRTMERVPQFTSETWILSDPAPRPFGENKSHNKD